MKSDRAPPIVAVQVEEEAEGGKIGKQRLAVRSSDILKAIEKEWHPIFNQPKVATYAEFVEK